MLLLVKTKVRNRLSVEDDIRVGFNKQAATNFEAGCPDANTTIILKVRLNIRLELYNYIPRNVFSLSY